MENDIESFMCLLEYSTKYMSTLLFEDGNLKLPDVIEAIEIMEHFENFKSIDDIKKVGNIHINKAIEELENNREMMKILKENTSLYN